MAEKFGDLHFLEIDKYVETKSMIKVEQIDFVRTYIAKMGIDLEEEPLIVISPLDSKIFECLLLDIITDYDMKFSSH